MVTIHSKDMAEILALYRMTKFDFPPHFLDHLLHSFPMMKNTMGSKLDSLAGRGRFLQKKCPLNGSLGGNWIRIAWLQSSVRPILSNKGELWFCPQKSLVHNASNELLGEPLASKVSEQQVDTLFVGRELRNYKKPNFWRKPAFIQIWLGKT